MLGSLALILYGFLPALQPLGEFGRIFAVYGGFFIVVSYLWGWALDGDIPDTGEWLGSSSSLYTVKFDVV